MARGIDTLLYLVLTLILTAEDSIDKQRLKLLVVFIYNFKLKIETLSFER